MALTLTKEDGTGLESANSYASAADGDSYHEGHLYATDWTGATTATKEAALVMATRLIDACYQFNGFRTNETQSLQFPRQSCPDPDKARITGALFSPSRGVYWDEDEVPRPVLDATCELARELIKADTTDARDGEGISQLSLTGSLHIQFDKKDAQPKIPRTVQLMLMKLGTYLGERTTMARLVRG